MVVSWTIYVATGAHFLPEVWYFLLIWTAGRWWPPNWRSRELTIIPACLKKVPHDFLACRLCCPKAGQKFPACLAHRKCCLGFLFLLETVIMKIVQKWRMLVKLKPWFDFCRSIWKYNFLMKLPESHMGAVLWRIHLISLMSQTPLLYHF